jgi:hypothetical protein
MNKFQVVLVDISYQARPDLHLKKWYNANVVLKEGDRLAKEQGYATFKIIGHANNVRKDYTQVEEKPKTTRKRKAPAKPKETAKPVEEKPKTTRKRAPRKKAA